MLIDPWRRQSISSVKPDPLASLRRVRGGNAQNISPQPQPVVMIREKKVGSAVWNNIVKPLGVIPDDGVAGCRISNPGNGIDTVPNPYVPIRLNADRSANKIEQSIFLRDSAPDSVLAEDYIVFVAGPQRVVQAVILKVEYGTSVGLSLRLQGKSVSVLDYPFDAF